MYYLSEKTLLYTFLIKYMRYSLQIISVSRIDPGLNCRPPCLPVMIPETKRMACKGKVIPESLKSKQFVNRWRASNRLDRRQRSLKSLKIIFTIVIANVLAYLYSKGVVDAEHLSFKLVMYAHPQQLSQCRSPTGAT